MTTKSKQEEKKEFEQLKELSNMEDIARPWMEAIERKDVEAAKVWKKRYEEYHMAQTELRNLTYEIREFIQTTSGYFTVGSVYTSLHLSNRKEKKHGIMCLLREVENGVLERHPSKNGTYRRVEKEKMVLEWKNANEEPMDIDWPLDLNQFFATYSRNIYVITGTPDAGKTAFCYDFIKRNMKKHEIHLYKSEELEGDIKRRLGKHNDTTLDEWRFKVFSHDHNYSHVLEPDVVNIIDYIDLNEETYKIGTYIREIYNKIKTGKGICLVGLQKPYGRDLGYGKEYALKIPRLYISIEGGIAKIIKCKDRKDDELNADGMQLEYKLYGGWKFVSQGVWHREEDAKLAKKARR